MKGLIIGAGKIGTAIHSGLAAKQDFEFWDKLPGKVAEQKDVAEAVAAADLIFLCIPSTGLIEALNHVKAHRKSEALVVSVTKGIEPQTSKFVSELLPDFVPAGNFALLSGPMLADDLLAGKGGAAVVASSEKKNFEILKNLFVPGFLKLEYENDFNSVAACGVLKNIYSIGAGLIDATECGNNVRGLYFSRSILESRAIMDELKLDRELFLGTAGVGDFIATATSSASMNRQAGFNIAKGLEFKPSEGTNALPELAKKLVNSPKYPMFEVISKIVAKQIGAAELIKIL